MACRECGKESWQHIRPCQSARHLWWKKLIHGTKDGHKHDWHYLGYEAVSPHFCEWDYCHCYKERCRICEVTVVRSAGTDEIR